MSRYIDADKLSENIIRQVNNPMIRNWLLAMVNDQPTVDVVEVKHGKWKVDETHDYEPYCSLCGHEPIAGEKYNYCPDCGADMRGTSGER